MLRVAAAERFELLLQAVFVIIKVSNGAAQFILNIFIEQKHAPDIFAVAAALRSNR